MSPAVLIEGGKVLLSRGLVSWLRMSPPPPKKAKASSSHSSVQEKICDFKICSWNVDGIRAWLKKGALEFILNEEKPDVACFQETKCSLKKMPKEILDLEDYPHQYWCSGEKEGYAGVGLISKVKPINVEMGLGDETHDKEGRLILAEFETFYLITTYVPNAGRKLVTLDKRMNWDPILRKKLQELDKVKPVIACGDFNVAHQEIDLANPKTNKKNAGFTVEERSSFDELLETGFVDTFRRLNPDQKGAYTFWTYMMNARSKNVGWRLDYFLVSERWMDDKICDSLIRSKVMGSDHCPLSLLLQLKE